MNYFEVKGNVGSSTLRYTSSGKPMLEFSVADNYGKDENKRTQWINCMVFGDAAEEFNRRITKGMAAHAFGRLEIQQYLRKDGTNGTSVKLWTDRILLAEEVQWGKPSNDEVTL